MNSARSSERRRRTVEKLGNSKRVESLSLLVSRAVLNELSVFRVVGSLSPDNLTNLWRTTSFSSPTTASHELDLLMRGAS